MINRGTTDRLEDAIDSFEETWSADAPSKIEDLLSEFGLDNDHEAIAELIRIDIELRYDRGVSIEVDDYLNRFNILRDRPDRVAEIAFEDFRARSANGHPVSPTRWRGLPGVSRKQWFQDLAQTTSVRRLNSRLTRLQADTLSDTAFQAALEESGFHLVQKIGEGAFSQVFLANQAELADRFVVLKIVTEALAEPERMALLQHTNIVPIYSYHRLLSRSVICMPYAGSVTLNDFLKDKSDVSARGGQSLVGTVLAKITDTKIARQKSESDDDDSVYGLDAHDAPNPAADDEAVLRPMEAFKSFDCEEMAIWIFQRLAGALAHAHARGVLHNDLKPSNVLIRNDGEPALLDFNLSQSLDRTRSGYAGGTLPYMSPETYRAMMGQQVQPRPTSDLYGLGVMLFEFVTGRLPYPTPKSIAPIDIAPAIEARRGPPDWNEDDEVTPGLKAIIGRCLQFEPDDRYQRADELQMDLQREQQNLSLVNTTEPKTWAVKKWTRRHPRTVWSGLVGAFLLAILIPLANAAISLKRSNEALNSQTAFERFSDESNEFLAATMADPDRQKKQNISRGMSVLERHGFLQRKTIDKHLAVFEGDEKVAARETMLRHFAHLGFLEVAHLSQIRLTDPSGARDFERLDRLISAAKIVEGDRPSRARLYLELDRARLAGNENRHAMLQQRVNDTIPDSDAELYLDAARSLANRDHEAASKRLTELADRDSIPSALRWTMLGRSQVGEKKYEDAKLSFTQSIERAPDSAKLFVLRGECHMALHQGVAAERDFRKANELDPDIQRAWFDRGQIHQARKEYADAIECYDRVLELSPRDFSALLKRSEIYRAMGRVSAAEADYQEALAAECDTQTALIARAKSRYADDPEGAVEDLYQARRLNPDRPFILSRIGYVLARKLHRYEEAAEIYTDVLKIQPANESALVDRALALARLNRFKEALELTRRAMVEPNDARNYYQAACVHALVGTEINRKNAVVLLSKAINAGYRNDGMEEDPDLESIRRMSGFQAALRVYRMAHPPASNRKRYGNVDED